ncbi:esterase EstD [Thermosipho sp. 1074]|uniref:esterase EstD n=1 Tax=Thermosipho sp. 1074 TaxID=1643331 RepID=UPI0009870C3C|nr:esterase EstD [Thermosipho sp. 1074]OOC42683.1 hypothetical protein XO08_06330 [Thermosipho sp. 1074]
MKRWIISIVIFSTFLFSSNFEKIAYNYFYALVNENYKVAYNLSSNIMKQHLPIEKIKKIWQQITSTYGKFEKIVKLQIIEKPPYKVFIFTSKFKKSNLNISITLNKEGKIDGLFFSPAQNVEYKIPQYVKSDKFVEKDVKVGDLPGKLTIPKEHTKYAVILIHGSGPQDMDETIGPNKIFKDIAYALSSNNIAVLRYNKRTLYQANENITIKEEIINDVLKAIKLLKDYNYKEIYLLGHSLGAYVAPYIATINDNISGLILLAPPARNLEDVIADQLKFLQNTNNEVLQKLQELKENKIPNDEFVLGAKAKYWYDLRSYNPLKYLGKVKTLILFGKNDYQVTLKDYNIFKEHLTNNTKIILFNGLTHLFIPGEKTPNAYLIENHVDAKVIDEIIKFIKN